MIRIVKMPYKYPSLNNISFGSKDATVSSKTSEYDNVPILPFNYLQYAQDASCRLYDSPPTGGEVPPPVPPHQINLTLEISDNQYFSQQNLYSPVKHLKQYPLAQPSAPEEPRQVEQRTVAKVYCNKEVQTDMTSLEPKEEPSLNTEGSQVAPKRLHSDSYGEMSRGSTFLFYLMAFLAEILLFGVLILCLVWVQFFREGLGWEDTDPYKQFNMHPVLMITGLIFCTGHAMLVYRLFRCCNRLVAKLMHTFLNLLAVPCIVVGIIAVFEFHNARGIPNLYSLHSWLGLLTMGLFALQLAIGFFSFWFLLCCEQSTSSFRANMVPLHATFGIVTFMLAVATCVTGLTEKALFSLTKESGKQYSDFVDETWIVNAEGIALALLAAIFACILYPTKFSRTSPVTFIEQPHSTSHYVMTPNSYYYKGKDPPPIYNGHSE